MSHTKWNTIKHKSQIKVQPKHAHLTEANALKAGEGAFKIRVFFSNNPYSENPCKSAWIRGYKRAERDFNDGLRHSARIQESLPMEVEA